MNNIIHSIQTQNAASVNINSSVNGGSTVFVRVLENNGGGSYVVSFAGQRFSVASEGTLEPGQTFRAAVQVGGDGKILLVPQKDVSSISGNISALTNIGSDEESLMNFLAGQGLVPDQVTVSLFQFLQQSGFKADNKILQKAYRIASLFPGKEKKAGQIAAMLLEEGVESDYQITRKILELLDGENGSGQGHNQNQQEKNEHDSNSSAEKKDVESYDLIEKVYGIKKSEGGLLAFVNQYGKNDRHWILLPYEWNCLGQNASGLISVLVDRSGKMTEKVVLTCKLNGKHWDFVLYYKSGNIDRLCFGARGFEKLPECTEMEDKLRDFLKDCPFFEKVPVEYSEQPVVDGYFTEDGVAPVVFGSALV